MKLAAAKNPDSLCSKKSVSGEMARPLWKNVTLLSFRSSNDPTISPAFHLKGYEVEWNNTWVKQTWKMSVPLCWSVVQRLLPNFHQPTRNQRLNVYHFHSMSTEPWCTARRDILYL